MAVHVEVTRETYRGRPYFVMERMWEDGFHEETIRVVPQEGMTAAESVEWHMLINLGMVASWGWDKITRHDKTVLRGQFTTGSSHGKAIKEVSDSRAHLVDF